MPGVHYHCLSCVNASSGIVSLLVNNPRINQDMLVRNGQMHMICTQIVPLQVKKCKKCKKDLTPILKVSRKLQELSKDFRMIMDTISEESAHQQIKHISSLLQEVEKVCKPPCKELITCQQVLIQCFAMLGNTVKVEIPPEKAQLVPFTGGGASYSDEDNDDDSEDEFDMPGLI